MTAAEDFGREQRDTAHRWQPYPYDAESPIKFACSRCGVYADLAWTIGQLPSVCPGTRARLPHIVMSTPGPLGPAAQCIACTLPPADAWDWECGGSRQYKLCQLCRQRRTSSRYRFYHMAVLCDECSDR